MAGMFRGIGRRLMGALSVTGGFKTHEAEAISSKLSQIETAQREAALVDAPVAPSEYKPNRAERSLARRRNRFRCSRNKTFQLKRGNQIDADGNLVAQARLAHENVSNSRIHYMFNTKLHALLYSSGAMDVGVNKEALGANV